MSRMKDSLHFVAALDCESFALRNGATTQCYQGMLMLLSYFTQAGMPHSGSHFKIYIEG